MLEGVTQNQAKPSGEAQTKKKQDVSLSAVTALLGTIIGGLGHTRETTKVSRSRSRSLDPLSSLLLVIQLFRSGEKGAIGLGVLFLGAKALSISRAASKLVALIPDDKARFAVDVAGAGVISILSECLSLVGGFITKSASDAVTKSQMERAEEDISAGLEEVAEELQTSAAEAKKEILH